MKHRGNDIIILNVGGIRHETLRSTLKTLPGTRLADDHQLTRHYRPERGEYFFDRSPSVFEYILNYYRVGELHLPSNICSNNVKKEFDYWGIDYTDLQGCCWLHYNAQRTTYITMQEFEKQRAGTMPAPAVQDEIPPGTSKLMRIYHRIRPATWAVLDDPFSSRVATAFAIVAISFLLISIFTFCAETHPYFRGNRTNEELPLSETTPGGEIKQEDILLWIGYPNRTIGILDFICYIFFTIEIVLRIVFSPNKIQFFRSGLNVLDAVLVVMFYIEMLVNIFVHRQLNYQRTFLRALFILRILRVFRVFRLARHHRGLQVLAYTMRASVREIFLLVMFLTIGVLLFGALVYYADQSSGAFDSIPHGLWWALVTMTTVGYGDMVPFSGLGKLVGGSCAVCGLLMIAFSAPVIVNNFMLFYNQIQYGSKPPECEREPPNRKWSIDSDLDFHHSLCDFQDALSTLSAPLSPSPTPVGAQTPIEGNDTFQLTTDSASIDSNCGDNYIIVQRDGRKVAVPNGHVKGERKGPKCSEYELHENEVDVFDPKSNVVWTSDVNVSDDLPDTTCETKCLDLRYCQTNI